MFADGKARCRRKKRADNLLCYSPDIPFAVVEAKARYKQSAEGLLQTMNYAEILGLRLAYATNSEDILEIDFTTGIEKELSNFPTPAELWTRLRHADGPDDEIVAQRLLTPKFPDRAKPLRYYQEIAVNRAVQAIPYGRNRALPTLRTGAVKTVVAVQNCRKLWQARWNSKGGSRLTKLLFLAEHNFGIDEPMAKGSRSLSQAAPVARDLLPDRSAVQHARTDCVKRWVLNPRLTRRSESSASADAGS